MPTPVDIRIARTIRDGGGITTRKALRAAKVTPASLRLRLEAGTLVEIHHDVFAFPQDELQPTTAFRAAVLSCGAGAVLSHEALAVHAGLLRRRDGEGLPLHVTVPRARNPRRATLTVHRMDLAPHERTEIGGLPCTTVARLVYDLARAGWARRRLERILDEAAFRGSWRRWELERILEQAADHPGAAVLRAVLREHVPGTTRTANELEERLLAICDAQGWPRPICQQPDRLRDGSRILHDFLWPALRLIVETDGDRGHRTRRQRRRDQRRDDAMRRRGYTVVRLRWYDVFERPDRVVALLAPLLDGRR
ncbi:DUF559 domain-containing protein [Conexibacter sp. W3-3-2]|uniref:DUF559 domain-containing protein n=1 Tax=Conexibacter sp. W3-3-2 TaxID=2675227 RepID=UPI0012B87C7D|nr:DUF559 domain-containing protein [Conexibacter sp. W3-3-2]MTD45357.1 DUF559 domain-containing protein [Conexibacter sp. W3-3-2]